MNVKSYRYFDKMWEIITPKTINHTQIFIYVPLALLKWFSLFDFEFPVGVGDTIFNGYTIVMISVTTCLSPVIYIFTTTNYVSLSLWYYLNFVMVFTLYAKLNRLESKHDGNTFYQHHERYYIYTEFLKMIINNTI